MRIRRTRHDDSTFALNLAPMLDVIVSITPMLLLSIAFIQVSVIESPLPQAVANAIEEQKKKPEVKIELEMIKEKGFKFIVNDNGKKREIQIAKKTDGGFDLDKLKNEAKQIKTNYPHVFHLDLKPDSKVALNEIVNVMDQLRKLTPLEGKFTFVDPKTGQKTETDLLFPDTVFANIMGQ